MDTESLKKSLVAKFVEMTQDRLQAVQLGVLELEKPEAARAAEAVARELHTMKGEARMLGLNAIGQLTHCCEDVLRAERDKKLGAREATDLLLSACDLLADLLDDLEAAREGSPETVALVQRISEASGAPIPKLKPTAASSSKTTLPLPKKIEPVSARPPQAVVSTAPPPSAPPPAPRASSDERVERPAAPERSIRVNVEILDALGLLAGDLLVDSSRSGLRSKETHVLFDRFSRLGERLLRLLEQQSLPEEERGQLAAFEDELHHLRDDAFRFVRGHADGVNTLHGNLTQMADQVAEARLVPLASVFEAFPRAAREMAHVLQKDVDLLVENTSAGVDRSLVLDLRDALVHLLRNSIDHGIEAPDARTGLGKPAVGQVALRARVEGGMLHVEIEDDGAGIDPERLRKVAVDRQFLTEGQAAALSEREAVELIFRPGFSTRSEVNELSGRGVGMDVVKKKVETLGGAVHVTSRMGRGTLISLRLPQSLALMRVLLVRLGSDVYGVPAADVEGVARFRPEERLELMGTVVVMHRQQPIAMVALGPLLGLNGGPSSDRPPCVVLRHGGEAAALMVDGFVGEREVAVKPAGGDFLKGAPFVAGSAALEDGRIAVLLQVPDLMAEVRKMARPAASPGRRKKLSVLLVDDSPIARATESAILRALGHTVEEASDGEIGWARLQNGAFDVIFTDVQMPNLDGIGLARRIKQADPFKKIPVVMLSSLSSPEDRLRGLEAGADAYLVKGELGVESLGQTIERLT